MTKITYVLIGILSIILATTAVHAASGCSEYIDLAEKKITPPYPNYFGAGEEYLHAAECFYKQGDIEEANSAYRNAAEKYERASQELVKDGDYLQAGISYQKAAESYEMIGEVDEAIGSYEKALKRYSDGGYAEEVKIVESRLEELRESESIISPTQADMRSIIGLVSLVALFVSATFLGIIAVANFPRGESGSGFKSNMDTGRTNKKEERRPTRKPSGNMNRGPTKETSRRDSSLSAEERVIKKIRERAKRYKE